MSRASTLCVPLIASLVPMLTWSCDSSNPVPEPKPSSRGTAVEAPRASATTAPAVPAAATASAKAPAPTEPGSVADEDWNDAQIEWLSFEAGSKRAKELKKPVCLVFYTQWCPHCKTYRKVFSDPRVVEKAKGFVMVRLDRDQHRTLSAKFAPDGEYIPRTLFLSSQGELDSSIHAPRERFKHFYDTSNPSGVLAGMNEALKKLK